MMKPALLVIDVQEAFVGHKRGNEEFVKCLDNINYSMDLFHKADLPVIVIRHVAQGDGKEHKNIKELHIAESDIEITKVYGNSFWRTKLEKVLRDLDVEFLVLCGNVAENCVNATYVGAQERDFVPTLLQNGVFARRKEFLLSHFFARELISCSAIEAMVGFRL